ncbi:hypothetical protein DPX16_15122 [Anabarilius grahami]|uniref:Uncharacterized protein n=1 Tax=Anabarilius grahami TaxID=495550 RepID=A0A3N0YYX0_ANAGA|nr:hypothetical protein DPX16_15122 [Anabarilius grahami]
MELNQRYESFTHGDLTWPVNQTFYLKVTKDFSQDQLNLGRTDVSVKCDETFLTRSAHADQHNRLGTTSHSTDRIPPQPSAGGSKPDQEDHRHHVQLLQHPGTAVNIHLKELCVTEMHSAKTLPVQTVLIRHNVTVFCIKTSCGEARNLPVDGPRCGPQCSSSPFKAALKL